MVMAPKVTIFFHGPRDNSLLDVGAVKVETISGFLVHWRRDPNSRRELFFPFVGFSATPGSCFLIFLGAPTIDFSFKERGARKDGNNRGLDSCQGEGV